jgi:hypothetical protein
MVPSGAVSGRTWLSSISRRYADDRALTVAPGPKHGRSLGVKGIENEQ